MIEAAVVFLLGYAFGRWSKTCRITVGPGDPIPSAVGEVAQALAGNEDAIARIAQVEELAATGDPEGVGRLHDLTAAKLLIDELAAAERLATT